MWDNEFTHYRRAYNKLYPAFKPDEILNLSIWHVIEELMLESEEKHLQQYVESALVR
jgi:hypothetical protein